jgi:hypothetical protein
MKITQHIPGFVDTRKPPQEGEFTTLAELEAIPFVARWKDEDLQRFSVSDGRYLMAEMNDGNFWVVGYLSGGTPDLPVWKAP